jgi:hypothetical protein
MKFIMYHKIEGKTYSLTVDADDWKDAEMIAKTCGYILKGELISSRNVTKGEMIKKEKEMMVYLNDELDRVEANLKRFKE